MAKKKKSNPFALDLDLGFDGQLAESWQQHGFDVEEYIVPEAGAENFIIGDEEEDSDEHECRYVRPHLQPVKRSTVRYEKAETLARDLGDLQRGERVDLLLSGKFIMGDFIEAYMVTNNLYAKRMLLSTLSFNENNVDSLKNLLDGDYVGQLDIVCSHYFFAHNRSTLVRYAYDQLDDDEQERFQLAVASTHTKCYLIELEDGRKLVMHGSCNLRSSGSIEQMCIEENPELYDFYAELNDDIIRGFSTIMKEKKYRGRWYEMTCKKGSGD